MNKALRRLIIYCVIGLICCLLAFYAIPSVLQESYNSSNKAQVVGAVFDTQKNEEITDKDQSVDEYPVIDTPATITHIATPESVKALYMTSWVAGTGTLRDKLLDIARKTEVNSIVFDIKDYTGKIAYPVEDPKLIEIGSSEKRIPNLREFTNMLHKDNLYIIGRVAVFQDPYFVSIHPEYAVKRATDKNAIWKDRKGISWIDAGEVKVWEYLADIARDAYAQGVDEIQFDYIRYPSDGNMKDIYFPASEGKVKAEVLKSFFEYLHSNFSNRTPVISADLFGMTATNTDDLGIGQNLEYALMNFDYVCPMVYPSHFPATWNGYKDPQSVPKEVIVASMGKAVERAKIQGIDPLKLRPWLQYFGLYGAKYTEKDIRAQIEGTYEVGLTSWMMWDPSNKYLVGGFLPE